MTSHRMHLMRGDENIGSIEVFGKAVPHQHATAIQKVPQLQVGGAVVYQGMARSFGVQIFCNDAAEPSDIILQQK